MIKELFRYFAAFVPLKALEKTFQLPAGREYQDFRQEIISAESDRRLDGIDAFILGADQEKLSQRISSVSGTFLFVEYARITSQINSKTDRQDNRLRVSVTVAVPEPDNLDLVSCTLNQERCLTLIKSIRTHMRDDDDLKRGIVWMDFPATLTVWSSKALANSHGWSMEFDILFIEN